MCCSGQLSTREDLLKPMLAPLTLNQYQSPGEVFVSQATMRFTPASLGSFT